MLWLENKALSHWKLNTLVGWMPLSGDSLREKSETSQQHFCHAEAPGQLPMRKETLGPAGCTGPELEPGDPWEAMTSQALSKGSDRMGGCRSIHVSRDPENLSQL